MNRRKGESVRSELEKEEDRRTYVNNVYNTTNNNINTNNQSNPTASSSLSSSSNGPEGNRRIL